MRQSYLTNVIRNTRGVIINLPIITCTIRAYGIVDGQQAPLRDDLTLLCYKGELYYSTWNHATEVLNPMIEIPLYNEITSYMLLHSYTPQESLGLEQLLTRSLVPHTPTKSAKDESNETIPNILVRYHKSENTDAPIIELGQISVGDWIDLRSRDRVELKAGDSAIIELNVSMQLPKGYEGIIAARSSTWLNHGVIYASSVGVIDNSYCGDDDIWHMPVYATRDTTIEANERICQFRIQKRMGKVQLTRVDVLHNRNRGGFGHTGKM